MSLCKSIWNQTSNVVAWIGIVIAGYTFYIHEIKKEHDVSIIVTSIDVADQEVLLSVLYRNNGDYQETFTGGTLKMSPISGGSSNASYLADCFDTVTIEPKKVKQRYYKVLLKRYVQDKMDIVDDTIKHNLDISFQYLLPKNEIGNDTFRFGNILHSVSKGAIKEFAVSKSMHKLSFSNKQNYGISSTIRSLKEVDDSLVCEKNV